MRIVRSRNRVPIRLTAERWKHIVRRHPEMTDQQERVLETLAEPEVIQQGDFGELFSVRHYALTPLSSKFLVVAYRETSSEDGFVVTAYLARRISERRTLIWKQ